MNRKLGQVNVVKVDFAGYRFYIRGQYKIGKTTLFKEILEKFYKDLNAGLLLSIGREDGYKALSGLLFERVTEWEVDEEEYNLVDEDTGERYKIEDGINIYMPLGFVNVVNELVHNRKNYLNIKLICLDVVDELIRLAEPVIIAEYNKGRAVNDRVKTIGQAYAGFQRGEKRVCDIIDEQLIRLTDAGYGLFQISHSKFKEVDEKGTDKKYQILAGSLSSTYDGIFAKKADFIATLSYEKDIENKQVTSAQRWINFRDDGFNVDCGVRFPEIVDRIEFTAENFINSVVSAIKAEASKGKTDSQILNQQKKDEKERIEKGLEFAKTEAVIKKPKKDELVENVKELFNSESTIREIKLKVADYITKTVKKKNIDELSIEELNKVLGILKGE